VAADGHQAAADERDIPRGVEQHQFAERVAEIDLGVRLAALAPRPRGKSHPLTFQRGAHFRKARRVARHEDQERARVLLAHPAMGVEQ